MKTSSNSATVLLRIALGLVFLWFGSNQLMNPSGWSGFLPDVALSFPLSPETLIQANGSFEILFAVLLLVGFFTRIVALLLAIHLGAIVLSVGFNEIGVRDFGLTCATLSLFFLPPDSLTFDFKFPRKKIF